MTPSDAERIATLEIQVAAPKKLLAEVVDKYNWHDHGYDYTSDSNSYDYDASTKSTGDRIDPTDMEEAFK